MTKSDTSINTKLAENKANPELYDTCLMDSLDEKLSKLDTKQNSYKIKHASVEYAKKIFLQTTQRTDFDAKLAEVRMYSNNMANLQMKNLKHFEKFEMDKKLSQFKSNAVNKDGNENSEKLQEENRKLFQLIEGGQKSKKGPNGFKHFIVEHVDNNIIDIDRQNVADLLSANLKHFIIFESQQAMFLLSHPESSMSSSNGASAKRLKIKPDLDYSNLDYANGAMERKEAPKQFKHFVIENVQTQPDQVQNNLDNSFNVKKQRDEEENNFFKKNQEATQNDMQKFAYSQTDEGTCVQISCSNVKAIASSSLEDYQKPAATYRRTSENDLKLKENPLSRKQDIKMVASEENSKIPKYINRRLNKSDTKLSPRTQDPKFSNKSEKRDDIIIRSFNKVVKLPNNIKSNTLTDSSKVDSKNSNMSLKENEVVTKKSSQLPVYKLNGSKSLLEAKIKELKKIQKIQVKDLPDTVKKVVTKKTSQLPAYKLNRSKSLPEAKIKELKKIQKIQVKDLPDIVKKDSGQMKQLLKELSSDQRKTNKYFEKQLQPIVNRMNLKKNIKDYTNELNFYKPSFIQQKQQKEQMNSAQSRKSQDCLAVSKSGRENMEMVSNANKSHMDKMERDIDLINDNELENIFDHEFQKVELSEDEIQLSQSDKPEKTIDFGNKMLSSTHLTQEAKLLQMNISCFNKFDRQVTTRMLNSYSRYVKLPKRPDRSSLIPIPIGKYTNLNEEKIEHVEKQLDEIIQIKMPSSELVNKLSRSLSSHTFHKKKDVIPLNRSLSGKRSPVVANFVRQFKGGSKSDDPNDEDYKKLVEIFRKRDKTTKKQNQSKTMDDDAERNDQPAKRNYEELLKTITRLAKSKLIQRKSNKKHISQRTDAVVLKAAKSVVLDNNDIPVQSTEAIKQVDNIESSNGDLEQLKGLRRKECSQASSSNLPTREVKDKKVIVHKPAKNEQVINVTREAQVSESHTKNNSTKNVPSKSGITITNDISSKDMKAGTDNVGNQNKNVKDIVPAKESVFCGKLPVRIVKAKSEIQVKNGDYHQVKSKSESNLINNKILFKKIEENNIGTNTDDPDNKTVNIQADTTNQTVSHKIVGKSDKKTHDDTIKTTNCLDDLKDVKPDRSGNDTKKASHILKAKRSKCMTESLGGRVIGKSKYPRDMHKCKNGINRGVTKYPAIIKQTLGKVKRCEENPDKKFKSLLPIPTTRSNQFATTDSNNDLNRIKLVKMGDILKYVLSKILLISNAESKLDLNQINSLTAEEIKEALPRTRVRRKRIANNIPKEATVSIAAADKSYTNISHSNHEELEKIITKVKQDLHEPSMVNQVLDEKLRKMSMLQIKSSRISDVKEGENSITTIVISPIIKLIRKLEKSTYQNMTHNNKTDHKQPNLLPKSVESKNQLLALQPSFSNFLNTKDDVLAQKRYKTSTKGLTQEPASISTKPQLQKINVKKDNIDTRFKKAARMAETIKTMKVAARILKENLNKDKPRNVPTEKTTDAIKKIISIETGLKSEGRKIADTIENIKSMLQEKEAQISTNKLKSNYPSEGNIKRDESKIGNDTLNKNIKSVKEESVKNSLPPPKVNLETNVTKDASSNKNIEANNLNYSQNKNVKSVTDVTETKNLKSSLHDLETASTNINHLKANPLPNNSKSVPEVSNESTSTTTEKLKSYLNLRKNLEANKPIDVSSKSIEKTASIKDLSADEATRKNIKTIPDEPKTRCLNKSSLPLKTKNSLNNYTKIIPIKSEQKEIEKIQLKEDKTDLQFDTLEATKIISPKIIHLEVKSINQNIGASESSKTAEVQRINRNMEKLPKSISQNELSKSTPPPKPKMICKICLKDTSTKQSQPNLEVLKIPDSIQNKISEINQKLDNSIKRAVETSTKFEENINQTKEIDSSAESKFEKLVEVKLQQLEARLKTIKTEFTKSTSMQTTDKSVLIKDTLTDALACLKDLKEKNYKSVELDWKTKEVAKENEELEINMKEQKQQIESIKKTKDYNEHTPNYTKQYIINKYLKHNPKTNDIKTKSTSNEITDKIEKEETNIKPTPVKTYVQNATLSGEKSQISIHKSDPSKSNVKPNILNTNNKKEYPVSMYKKLIPNKNATILSTENISMDIIQNKANANNAQQEHEENMLNTASKEKQVVKKTKKYHYETKEVRSFTGAINKITYLVEDKE